MIRDVSEDQVVVDRGDLEETGFPEFAFLVALVDKPVPAMRVKSGVCRRPACFAWRELSPGESIPAPEKGAIQFGVMLPIESSYLVENGDGSKRFEGSTRPSSIYSFTTTPASDGATPAPDACRASMSSTTVIVPAIAVRVTIRAS